MDFLCPQGEWLSSYKRCTEMGIDPSITTPLIILNLEGFRIKNSTEQGTHRCF